MKKYSYIVAVACIMAGALGLTGMYVVERSQQKQEQLAKEEQDNIGDLNEIQNPQVNLNEIASNSENEQTQVVEDENTNKTISQQENSVAKNDAKISENNDIDTNKEQEESVEPVEIIKEEALHFNPKEDGIVWPIEGAVLLDYSKDTTIYFPTLQQYQYHPAMVIAGEVNSKVYFVAKGKITNIETNEVTGCTVTQDIGDGYTVKYGQLKELNFKVGDTVESGQVVGYVNEPTKYYSVEGPNVYFQVLKDNEPIDPQELLDNSAS